jgi:protein-tyrosine-phosphatase
MNIGDGFRRLWADPVWSKVIAAGIIAALSFLSVIVSNRVGSMGSSIKAAIVIGGIVLMLSASFYGLMLLYSRRRAKILVFVSSGGTCRDPMAKAIATKLLEGRKLKHHINIKAAALGPLSKSEASYAARYVIKEMYNEDLLADHRPEPLTPRLMEQADLILVMDKSLLSPRGKNFPVLPVEKSFVLKEFFGLSGDVRDPWPDGKDVTRLNEYRKCANELRDILSNNLDHLVKVLDL